MERINIAIKFIEENMSTNITLHDLANVSNLSLFHFSRVFKNIMSETPMLYLKRKRIEKSAYYLKNSNLTSSEIAYKCGFNSISTFNTNFKKHYNLTPSEFKRQKCNNSNFPITYSNNKKDLYSQLNNNTPENNLINRIWGNNINLTELPDYNVAYIRSVGSYMDLSKNWKKLINWSLKNIKDITKCDFIGTPLDNPNYVEEHSCRYDSCITLPKAFKAVLNKHVNFKTISGGLFIKYNFYDTNEKLVLTYKNIFDNWFPNSNYMIDNRETLEFCKNNPEDDPYGKCLVDLYIPVREKENGRS